MPSLRRYLFVAALLTLVSGGAMVWAGYLAATRELNSALWITLVAWAPIAVGFALIRRADRAADWPKLSAAARLREEIVIVLAGAVMVFAGYAGETVSWLLAVPMIVTGGFVVAGGLSGHHPEHKRHVVRTAEKYLVNPLVKAILALGLPLPLVLLETTGRHSGQPRRTPVMKGIVGNELWIVAEHGLRAGYVRNLAAEPHVRVKVGQQWREGIAEVCVADDPIERVGWIAQQLGRSKKMEVLVTRLFCVDPVTIRVDLAGATGPEGLLLSECEQPAGR